MPQIKTTWSNINPLLKKNRSKETIESQKDKSMIVVVPGNCERSAGPTIIKELPRLNWSGPRMQMWYTAGTEPGQLFVPTISPRGHVLVRARNYNRTGHLTCWRTLCVVGDEGGLS